MKKEKRYAGLCLVDTLLMNCPWLCSKPWGSFQGDGENTKQSRAIHSAGSLSLLWLCNISQKRQLHRHHCIQTLLTLFCWSATSHSLYQSDLLWQGCEQNALKDPKIPQLTIIACYQCSVLLLAELCLIFSSLQHTELFFSNQFMIFWWMSQENLYNNNDVMSNSVSLSNIKSCAPVLPSTDVVKRVQWTEAVPQLRIYNYKHYYQEKHIDLTSTRNH